MKYAIAVLGFAVLVVIVIMLWQMWRKFKSIPEDEVIGEARTKYLTTRLNVIAVCAGAEAALQILAAILRLVEVI